MIHSFPGLRRESGWCCVERRDHGPGRHLAPSGGEDGSLRSFLGSSPPRDIADSSRAQNGRRRILRPESPTDLCLQTPPVARTGMPTGQPHQGLAIAERALNTNTYRFLLQCAKSKRDSKLYRNCHACFCAQWLGFDAGVWSSRFRTGRGGSELKMAAAPPGPAPDGVPPAGFTGSRSQQAARDVDPVLSRACELHVNLSFGDDCRSAPSSKRRGAPSCPALQTREVQQHGRRAEDRLCQSHQGCLSGRGLQVRHQ